ERSHPPAVHPAREPGGGNPRAGRRNSDRRGIHRAATARPTSGIHFGRTRAVGRPVRQQHRGGHRPAGGAATTAEPAGPVRGGALPHAPPAGRGRRLREPARGPAGRERLEHPAGNPAPPVRGAPRTAPGPLRGDGRGHGAAGQSAPGHPGPAGGIRSAAGQRPGMAGAQPAVGPGVRPGAVPPSTAERGEAAAGRLRTGRPLPTGQGRERAGSGPGRRSRGRSGPVAGTGGQPAARPRAPGRGPRGAALLRAAGRRPTAPLTGLGAEEDRARKQRSRARQVVVTVSGLGQPTLAWTFSAILSPVALSTFRQYSKAFSRTGLLTPLERCPATLSMKRSRSSSLNTFRTRVPAWVKSSSSACLR